MKKILLSLLCLLLVAVGVSAAPGMSMPAVNNDVADVSSSGDTVYLEDLREVGTIVSGSYHSVYHLGVKGSDASYNITGTAAFTPDSALDTDFIVSVASGFDLIGTGSDTVDVTVDVKESHDFKFEVIKLGTLQLTATAENSTDSGVTVAPITKTLYYDAKSRLVFGNSNDLTDIGVADIEEDDQFIEVKIDGDRDDIGYGDYTKKVKVKEDIEFKLEASNMFSDDDDMQITDVQANLFIKDIDGGDDLDEDIDIDDIKEDSDESTTYTYTIPYDAEAGDYDAILTLTGEDDYGAEHTAVFEFTVRVDRDKEVWIRKASFSDTRLACGDTSTKLSVELVNMDDRDHDDIGLIIQSDALDVYIEETDIELDSVQDDVDDGTYKKTYTIQLPANTKPGDYDFTILGLINDEEYDADGVSFTVEECVQDNDSQDTADNNNNDDAVINNPITITPGVTDGNADGATTDTTTDEMGSDNSYLILLAAGNVVLFVAVIGLLIAVVSGTRRRRD